MGRRLSGFPNRGNDEPRFCSPTGAARLLPADGGDERRTQQRHLAWYRTGIEYHPSSNPPHLSYLCDPRDLRAVVFRGRLQLLVVDVAKVDLERAAHVHLHPQEPLGGSVRVILVDHHGAHVSIHDDGDLRPARNDVEGIPFAHALQDRGNRVVDRAEELRSVVVKSANDLALLGQEASTPHSLSSSQVMAADGAGNLMLLSLVLIG